MENVEKRNNRIDVVEEGERVQALRIWPIYVNKHFPLSLHITAHLKSVWLMHASETNGPAPLTAHLLCPLSHLHMALRSVKITHRPKVNSSKTVMGYEIRMLTHIHIQIAADTRIHTKVKHK